MPQGPEPRRRFLRQMIAIVPATNVAAAGTVVAGTALTQAACSGASAAPASDYQPAYFTEAEWAFVQAAVDRLIPADAMGPGALVAGVPEFIDRQMDTPYGHGQLWYMQGPFHPDQPPEMGYQMSLVPRDIYRHGIAACDAWCVKNRSGKTFAQLDHAAQEAVLADLEKKKIDFDAVPGHLFFSYLLTNAKEGFFADPIHGGNKGMVGWKMVGFPGVRADYMDWVDQPGATYPYGPVSIDGQRG